MLFKHEGVADSIEVQERVGDVLAAQFNATADTAGTFVYAPALGTVLGAGLVQQKLSRGTIIGTLWNDTNQDSLLAGESGFANGTVELLAADGARLRTAATGQNGEYTFSNVLPGRYRIRFLKPAGIDHFSARGGDSAVFPASGLSDFVSIDLGDTARISAGISADPIILGLTQAEPTAPSGVLRTAAETAQGTRLHHDQAAGEVTLRWTLLPLLRTADGTDYFPAQHIEISTDMIHWEGTGITIPASSSGAPREERISVQTGPRPTFLRVRVENARQ